MTKKRSYLTPLLLFLGSFIIRLSLIGKGPYHSDTLKLALDSQKSFETFQLYYLQGSGLPLTSLLGAVFQGIAKLLGITDPVIAVNLMSVVLSSLCVSLLYFVVKELLDHHSALFASIIFSVNPAFLAISEFGNSHPPSLMFLFLGLIFLLKYKKDLSFRSLIISAVLLGCMGAARLQDYILITLPLVFLFWLPIKDGQQKSQGWMGKLFLFFTVQAITITVFYIPLLLQKAPGSAVTDHISYYMHLMKTSLMLFNVLYLLDAILYLLLFKYNITHAIAILGFIYLWSRNRNLAGGLLVLFLFPVLLIITFWVNLPRYFIIPSLALIIAEGYFFAHFMKDKAVARKGVLAIFGISIFLNFFGVLPIIQMRHQSATLADYYKWLAVKTEPNAYIIERDHSLFIEYYSKRTPIGPPISMLKVDHMKLRILKGEVDAYLRQGIPVYITESGLKGYPKPINFDEFVKKYYTLELAGTKLTEQWYRGVLKKNLLMNRLYRLRPKEQ